MRFVAPSVAKDQGWLTESTMENELVDTMFKISTGDDNVYVVVIFLCAIWGSARTLLLSVVLRLVI